MASVTLTASADVACWTNQTYAAGLGDHLPVGTWSTAVYRSAVRFTKPSWASWTNITKATLEVYISDHQHVGVRNSTILVRRQTIANLWTKSAGTQDCENGFASANNTQNSDLTSSSTDSTTFSSGTTANAKKSITVTNAVKYYWNNDASVLVFTFAGNSSSDYTELWSREKGSTYDARLIIEYEVQSPPVAPTLGYPSDGATVLEQEPVLTWTHSDPQGDPQAEATVELDGVENVVAGATNSFTCPTLARGSSHTWRVKTSDGLSGYGPYSALRSFTVKALPVVTVDATRYMEYAAGHPRLRVKWSANETQTKYRIQTSTGYDSGWLNGTTQNVLLTGFTPTNGVAVTVTVSVETAEGLQNSDAKSFTPRWGLTTHKQDLGSIPANWDTPSVDADAGITVEYGSHDNAGATAPYVWQSTMSAVTRRRYLFWRAWFMPPSGSVSPVLRSISIPANFTVTLLDDWYKWTNQPFAAPWFVDTSEAVYGTRSVSVECDGSGLILNSKAVKLRAGRSYILTGLMKSQGASGAYFGFVGAGGEGILATSEVINETREWYTPDDLDVYRYKTPVYTAPQDMEVYVWLVATGPAGTQAWFDAIKLEESTVATPWSPSAIGATVIDSGGVQVDGNKGGVFRYKGSTGGLRDVVEGGAKGLVFGGDTEIASPSTDVISINGVPIPDGVARWQ